MAKIIDEYKRLSNLKSERLNDNVVRSLLIYVNDIKTSTDFTLSLENECKNIEKLHELVNKVLAGIPYQYVINSSIFLGNDFYVDSRVLIPRNETEELTLNVIKLIDELNIKTGNVFDICSGSGVIAISIKKKYPDLNVFGSDISKDAIEVSEINNKRLNTNVEFRQGNLFEPFKDLKVDVLVSNPPYIGIDEEVDEMVLKHEPHLALFANPRTKFYEEMFSQIQNNLNDIYLLAFEISPLLVEPLKDITKKYFKDSEIRFEKDMYNNYRYLYIIKR